MNYISTCNITVNISILNVGFVSSLKIMYSSIALLNVTKIVIWGLIFAPAESAYTCLMFKINTTKGLS